MAVALVLTTAISLGFLGAALLTNRYITKYNNMWQSKLSIQVFLCMKHLPAVPDNAQNACQAKYTAAETDALRQALSTDPLVRSFTFINDEQAIKRATQALPKGQAALAGPNTFPASFAVKLRDIKTGYAPFLAKYNAFGGVRQVQNEDESLKSTLLIFGAVRLLSIVVALMIMVCAAILVAMTIQVAAAQRRVETNIMRLVGASRVMTQLPFMIEAIISAVIGGILALVLDAAGVALVLGRLFHGPVKNGLMPTLGVADVMTWGGLGVLVGIVLTALISWITLRLYVRL
ncbi:MAG: permease-like cell division protein FtsX [Actinomycetia bacterium]|nr:permease-like cell division protein FtsX [Actinomycetes bacterium]